MDVALDVELHFQGTVPVLESEHGSPVQPEVRVEHLVIEKIGDRPIVELFVWSEEQLHDLSCRFVAKAEFAIGVGVLSAIFGGSTQGVVWVFFVQPVILVENGNAWVFDGGD